MACTEVLRPDGKKQEVNARRCCEKRETDEVGCVHVCPPLLQADAVMGTGSGRARDVCTGLPSPSPYQMGWVGCWLVGRSKIW